MGEQGITSALDGARAGDQDAADRLAEYLLETLPPYVRSLRRRLGSRSWQQTGDLLSGVWPRLLKSGLDAKSRRDIVMFACRIVENMLKDDARNAYTGRRIPELEMSVYPDTSITTFELVDMQCEYEDIQDALEELKGKSEEEACVVQGRLNGISWQKLHEVTGLSIAGCQLIALAFLKTMAKRWGPNDLPRIAEPQQDE